MKPKIITIVGPTASGKTSLGIDIAKKIHGEIISVDSRQVYRGMDIGTAKPEGERREEAIQKGGSINQLFGERQYLSVEGISHWGIDLVNPNEDYSVAQFKEYAERRIQEILAREHVPILVGGTGLWVKAIIDNLTMTEVPPDASLRAELESRPAHDLYGEYKQLDPKGAETIDKFNKRRLIRALEVTKKTRQPFSEQLSAGEPFYDALQIGLEVDREVLIERIDARVDEMIARGLVDEVRKLKDEYGCEAQAMSGIGYQEICRFLNGEIKLAEAIEEIKTHTRQYAKRQMTWFRRDERIRWIKNPEDALGMVLDFL